MVFDSQIGGELHIVSMLIYKNGAVDIESDANERSPKDYTM